MNSFSKKVKYKGRWYQLGGSVQAAIKMIIIILLQHTFLWVHHYTMCTIALHLANCLRSASFLRCCLPAIHGNMKRCLNKQSTAKVVSVEMRRSTCITSYAKHQRGTNLNLFPSLDHFPIYRKYLSSFISNFFPSNFLIK